MSLHPMIIRVCNKYMNTNVVLGKVRILLTSAFPYIYFLCCILTASKMRVSVVKNFSFVYE